MTDRTLLRNTFDRRIYRYRYTSNPGMRLFCFPYAGGGASIYSNWHKMLPADIELNAVQLPGRESLFNIPALSDLSQLLPALLEAITPLMDRPFAFFGHSLGALICFELIRSQRRAGLREPLHLFVSGARAPQIPIYKEQIPVHQLSSEAFKERIRRYNGTPEEVLNNNDLFQLLLPTLRADFQLFETYTYIPGARLNCPITVFGGTEDARVSSDDLYLWQEQTNARFTVHTMQGDHFFLQKCSGAIIEILTRDLEC